MNNRYFKRLAKGAVLFTASLFSMTSCGDFFDVESTHTVDAGYQLNNATDTIYSMIGILNKLQAIGDRTVLLGEARGDLVNITDVTNADLRAVADFTVGDENKYNTPADYYAVINNCNYYIHHVDTSIINNRTKQGIFRKEYAVVKAVRAWTYLQLVTTYGRVPFVTEPILSISESLKNYPMMDIQGICNYFINEDGLDKLVDQELPTLNNIYGMPSRKFYFPVRLVLADLNLWAGNYLQAAKYYHDFLTNGSYNGGINPTTIYSVEWNDNSWRTPVIYSNDALNDIKSNETITVIPMDSIPSAGHFSELPGIFNSMEAKDYAVSLVPSEQMFNISKSQWYCYPDYVLDNGVETIKPLYAPQRTEYNKTGDLRLGTTYQEVSNGIVEAGGKSYDIQYISKYPNRARVSDSPMKHQIRVYRRTLVYLRLAEAMNRAGYPRYAFQILSSGINNKVIEDSVAVEYPAQAEMLKQEYGFIGDDEKSTATNYIAISDPKNYYSRVIGPNGSRGNINTIGLHSRGSGYTPINAHYQFPKDLPLDKQIEWVEDKILEEGALEFAFEGFRYYDILRVALRRTNEPAFLKNMIEARGTKKEAAVNADLMNKANWFLNWKNQIGYNVK